MEHDTIHAVDYHTGGEPFRIVTDTPPLRAATVANKRLEAIDDPATDGLRRLLCSEPRGHADMYGGFITEPDDDGAHFGVLFWHKDGFSTACGHGTIALGAWAINTGLVAVDPSGVTEVIVDVPSGRVTGRVHTTPEGRVTSVDFVNVESYQLHERVVADTSSGPVVCTIGFGGAIYAHVEAASIGAHVAPGHLPRLIEASREIKSALEGTAYVEHPTDPRLSGLYGVIYYDDLGTDEQGDIVQRNVTVFADAEVDRSPCGSGTCSRLAVLAASGRLGEGRRLVHHSVVGSTFIGQVLDRRAADGRLVVTPVVTGSAYVTGDHRFLVDPDDDLIPGFVLR